MQANSVSMLMVSAWMGILVLLSACNAPRANMAFVSPNGKHWVSMEQVAPLPDGESLLPTWRLRLQDAWHSQGALLLDGVETLCATEISWKDDANLLLRVPADRVFAIKIHEGESWQGIKLHVQVHEDQVTMERWSADGQRRLIVIETCETQGWNLYLRRVGEPSYNEAMKTGWDDPDVFGGFEATQPPIALRWTGLRSAEIEVPGKAYGVTLRKRIADVSLRWKFISNFKVPEKKAKTLQPLLLPQ
jgi:hypothetical protein